MARRNEILGDVTQAPRGTVRGAAGSSGSGLNHQNVEARKIVSAVRPPLRKHCCKTCKGEGCVGYCKY